MQSKCPDGWSTNQFGNSQKTYCCWGSGHINNDDGYCCTNKISADRGDGDVDVVSSLASDSEIRSDCFPFCDDNRKRDISDDLCGEKIPFSASDYSERVSAASKSAMSEASGTATDSPASTTAEPTNSADDGATTTGGDSDGAQETGGDATSSNSDNAAPLPTGHAMAKVGGAIAAAAVLAL